MMSAYKRGQTYWYKFLFQGQLIHESAKTNSKTVAREAELRAGATLSLRSTVFHVASACRSFRSLRANASRAEPCWLLTLLRRTAISQLD